MHGRIIHKITVAAKMIMTSCHYLKVILPICGFPVHLILFRFKVKKTRRKPENLDSMLDVAQKMARATGQKFKYGLAYYLNDYVADGTIFDYMAGVRKVQ